MNFYKLLEIQRLFIYKEISRKEFPGDPHLASATTDQTALCFNFMYINASNIPAALSPHAIRKAL